MTVNTRIKVETVGWRSMGDLLIPTRRVREEAGSCILYQWAGHHKGTWLLTFALEALHSVLRVIRQSGRCG
jgi:hypothetical protein